MRTRWDLRATRSISASILVAACGGSQSQPDTLDLYQGGQAPHSRAADDSMITVPAGRFVAGSTPEERERAYGDYLRTAGRDTARNNDWFDREQPRHMVELDAFALDQAPVTNAAYAEFVADTGREPPRIDRESWKEQGFVQDYETEVERFNWTEDGQPPQGRADHPVVLVTWDDARTYCRWRGDLVGERRRLPTAMEYEKAARGTDGLAYPWGNDYAPDRLDDRVNGPGDTMPVGSFPEGASPYGMLDAAGNVFEWTSTPWKDGGERRTVKGSAWDDHAGVGRPAQRHGRREGIRHAIVGFRCAGPAPRGGS